MSGPAMEFLLVLSALMSALTGAFGPRATEARLAQAEAQMVAVAEAAIPARIAAPRPQQALPSIVALSRDVPAIKAAPALLAPLAFVRLIE